MLDNVLCLWGSWDQRLSKCGKCCPSLFRMVGFHLRVDGLFVQLAIGVISPSFYRWEGRHDEAGEHCIVPPLLWVMGTPPGWWQCAVTDSAPATRRLVFKGFVLYKKTHLNHQDQTVSKHPWERCQELQALGAGMARGISLSLSLKWIYFVVHKSYAEYFLTQTTWPS